MFETLLTKLMKRFHVFQLKNMPHPRIHHTGVGVSIPRDFMKSAG